MQSHVRCSGKYHHSQFFNLHFYNFDVIGCNCMYAFFFPTDFLDLTIPRTEEPSAAIENSYYHSRVTEHYQTF